MISPNDPILKYQPLWGSWDVEELIGKGSFGRVYRISKDVYGDKYTSAVKLITVPTHDQFREARMSVNVNEDELTEYFEDIVKNIINEISLLYQLRGHSNIVSYEDHTVEKKKDILGWDILIKMEYVTSLVDYMSEHRLTRGEIVRIGIDICSALETCEKMNIIHRDIKDENIFVSKQGSFKLGDFGIARELSKSGRMASMKGTPLYMAPEVFRGENYDSRVDVYSLGMVLYRLLNMGRMPLAPDYPQKLRREDNEKALERRLSGEDLPVPKKAGDELGRIILKACSFKPSERYSGAGEMRNALQYALNEMSVSQKEEEIIEIRTKPGQTENFGAAPKSMPDDYIEDTVLLDSPELPQKRHINGKKSVDREVGIKTGTQVEYLTVGTNEVAFMGVSHGVGVTHTAIMYANFLCSKYRVAVLELNQSGDFKEIYTLVENGRSSDSSFFRYKGVDFYWNIDYSQFISKHKDDYDFVVLDLGSYDELYDMEDFIRSDIRIVLGHAIDWKLNEIRQFYDSTRKYDPNNSWYFFIPFLTEKHISDVKEFVNNKVYTIPFNTNPFSPSEEIKNIFNEVLGIKDANQKKKGFFNFLKK